MNSLERKLLREKYEETSCDECNGLLDCLTDDREDIPWDTETVAYNQEDIFDRNTDYCAECGKEHNYMGGQCECGSNTFTQIKPAEKK